MAHPPGDTVGQQAGQRTVDGRVGLAEKERQLRRVDERHPAEGVEQLSFRGRHVSIVGKKRQSGQSPRGSTDT